MTGVGTAQERWYSVKDVARYLGLSPYTIQRWLREGQMEGYYFGGRLGYRVTEQDVKRFIEKRSKSRSSDEARKAQTSGTIRITVGTDLVFLAQFQDEAAPITCAEFRKLLPYRQKLIQARWSGEAAWIPLGEFTLDVSWENPTSYPAAGEILFYPGGFSETEILFPYGRTCFASTMGQLAGNHFLTIVEGKEQLTEVGRRVLWEGAQEILFEQVDG